MGVIAAWAAIVAFTGAALMIILSVFGFAHARWTRPDTEILTPHGHEKITA
jgi:hypothetical protein